jgi:NAD-dependent DNA ligase
MTIAKDRALKKRGDAKSLNTLDGLLSGITCDGHLSDTEVLYLDCWLKENMEIIDQYPINQIYRAVREVLQDNKITEAERDRLLALLKEYAGQNFDETGSVESEFSFNSFDDDPHIIYEGRVFVMTGTFSFGHKEKCHYEVTRRGGICGGTVTKKTNYLVIGDKASKDWIARNYGRKIQKAVEMIESGDYEISIIREKDWRLSLATEIQK